MNRSLPDAQAGSHHARPSARSDEQGDAADQAGSGAAKSPRRRASAKIDVHKLRAEHFARDFESLRQTEWRVVFQLYVGYGAVALAYSKVKEPEALGIVAGVTAVLLTLLLFWTTFYALLRLQEHRHAIRRMQIANLEELNQVLRAPDSPFSVGEATSGGYSLFIAQTILSSVVAATLIIYEVATALASVASK